MTCVWDSLVAGLRRLSFFPEGIGPLEFARHVQAQNRKLGHREVLVNGDPLRSSEVDECYSWIRDMDVSGNGYLCSSHDPLLIFTSSLFRVRIIHTFLGHRHDFVPTAPIRGTITLSSSSGHMSLTSVAAERADQLVCRRRPIATATSAPIRDIGAKARSSTTVSRARPSPRALQRSVAAPARVEAKQVQLALRVLVRKPKAVTIRATPIFSVDNLRAASFRTHRPAQG